MNWESLSVIQSSCFEFLHFLNILRTRHLDSILWNFTLLSPSSYSSWFRSPESHWPQRSPAKRLVFCCIRMWCGITNQRQLSWDFYILSLKEKTMNQLKNTSLLATKHNYNCRLTQAASKKDWLPRTARSRSWAIGELPGNLTNRNRGHGACPRVAMWW